MTGPLLDSPYKVGSALGGPLQGTYAARRGSYRILYVVDDDEHLVTVRDVDHRADVYWRR